jgi:hypothetical protein
MKSTENLNSKRAGVAVDALVRGFFYYCVPVLAVKTVPLWWNRPIEDVPTKIAFRWQTLPDGWIFISANLLLTSTSAEYDAD